MTTPKLKPCPFCGHKRVALCHAKLDTWFVFCRSHQCGRQTGPRGAICDTKKEAIVAWNRRAKEST